MNQLKINKTALAIYLFVIIFLFLAGMSIGRFMLFIFYIFLFIPLLSLMELVYVSICLKNSQEFSNEHPQKGDIIEYRLILYNESPLRISNIKIEFAMTFPVSDQNFEMEEKILALNASEKWTHHISIRCEYRGIYMVGVRSISISDSLGWIQYYRKVWHRTFYVYPRIIILPGLPFVSRDETGTSETLFGSQEDYSLLKTLVPYREGESIKNIYWKKFALYNQPILKDYLQSSVKAIDIYLDSSRKESVSRSVLIREDCAIEIAVALIRYFLNNGIPLEFHFMGRERYDFKSSQMKDFATFHKKTINFHFGKSISGAEFYKFDSQNQTNKGVSILFITHSIDSEYFDIAVKNQKSRKLFVVILNTTGLEADQKDIELSRIQNLRQYGVLVYVVHHSETLMRDLKI